ncbi:hypothetical protein FH972_024756 [Carpinus fangiana]|uniref:Uncharacterized protein n=1 Tax=Carpinus fangiana TaxID=176857 RepID=A0A5N6KYX5_9ROSI|nr:hypothetical protein FH972_024756 [Carpinus fangiana]
MAGLWDLRGVRVLNVVVVGYWILKGESVNLEGLLLKVEDFVLMVAKVEVEGQVRVAMGVSLELRNLRECSVFEENSGEGLAL